MKKYIIFVLIATVCVVSCCCPDDEENTADVTFIWLGSGDFLKVTEPIVTWTAFGATPGSVDDASRIIKIHFEDFDSLLVMATATYPSLSQLLDTVGKVFYVGRILTGSITTTDGNGKLSSSNSIEEFSVDTIYGDQLEKYVQSRNGTIGTYGYVVYRDGRYRVKERWVELNWTNNK